MEVLVQNELVIGPERLGSVAQENAVAARGRACAEMKARVPGAFDHSHLINSLAEDLIQREQDVLRA